MDCAVCDRCASFKWAKLVYDFALPFEWQGDDFNNLSTLHPVHSSAMILAR